MAVGVFMAKKLPKRGRLAANAVASPWPMTCRLMAIVWPIAGRPLAAELQDDGQKCGQFRGRNSLTPLGVQRPYEIPMFPQGLPTPEWARILSAILDKSGGKCGNRAR